MASNRSALRVVLTVAALVALAVGVRMTAAPSGEASDPRAPERRQGPAIDSIPFELEDARIYVPVGDSAGPLGWFILDTGAQPSGVDVRIAERWRATALGSGTSTGAGGGRTRSATIPGRRLRVGNVPFETPTLVAQPLDSLLGAVSGRVVSGIIGSAFFRQHAVTIDFDRRLVYVRRPGTLGTAAGATELRIRLGSDVPFVAGTVTLPDGRTIPANYLVDLGAKATVLFAEPFMRRHAIEESITGPSFVAPLGAGIGGRTRYRFARMPQVTLGPDSTNAATRWTNVVVGLSVGGTLGASYFDGLFGLDMLLRFTPSFDYATARLVLAPRANPPAPSEIDLSGVFLTEERSPRTIRVSAVIDGSPAADAGIAAGDELIAIDGTAAGTLSLAAIRDMLRSSPGRRVELRLKRGEGSAVSRTLVLRRMA